MKLQILSQEPTDRCDLCASGEGVLECLLPYSERKKGSRGGLRGRYYDLCRTCQGKLEAHPSRYVTIDTDVRWHVLSGTGGTVV